MFCSAKKKENEKKQASKAENVERTNMGETVLKPWKQALQIILLKYFDFFFSPLQVPSCAVERDFVRQSMSAAYLWSVWSKAFLSAAVTGWKLSADQPHRESGWGQWCGRDQPVAEGVLKGSKLVFKRDWMLSVFWISGLQDLSPHCKEYQFCHKI